MENLCAETYRTVRDVYLQDMLEQKLLRDQESIEMMHINMDSQSVLDPCWIYNFGNLSSVIPSSLKNTKTDIVSKMDALKEKLTTEVNQSLDVVKNQ